MLPGLAVRGWAIRALGEYLTGNVQVSPDQTVVTAGPYRLLWRIHAEERTLLATLGAPYRAYAAQHKRPVPLVW